jgi:ankyrin repeat protein
MGLVDEAKFVMKHGASVAQAGKAMLTPLHSAVLFGGVEGVTALLKHTVPKGGTPVDVNALTATGQTVRGTNPSNSHTSQANFPSLASCA